MYVEDHEFVEYGDLEIISPIVNRLSLEPIVGAGL
jgi:hypothetical protein